MSRCLQSSHPSRQCGSIGCLVAGQGFNCLCLAQASLARCNHMSGLARHNSRSYELFRSFVHSFSRLPHALELRIAPTSARHHQMRVHIFIVRILCAVTYCLSWVFGSPFGRVQGAFKVKELSPPSVSELDMLNISATERKALFGSAGRYFSTSGFRDVKSRLTSSHN